MGVFAFDGRLSNRQSKIFWAVYFFISIFWYMIVVTVTTYYYYTVFIGGVPLCIVMVLVPHIIGTIIWAWYVKASSPKTVVTPPKTGG